MHLRMVLVGALVCGCGFDAVHPDPPSIDDGVLPPPVSGGTLLASRKTHVVFAANPDRDVVEMVDMNAHAVVWRAHFNPQSEPGRMIEADDGLVHVVLRRAGEIATLNPALREFSTRAVCPSPRGITSTADDIIVVCESGELVFLSRRANAARTVALGRDLRDVVVDGSGNLYVTRFRSAELVMLDRWGAFVTEARPPLLKQSIRNENKDWSRDDALVEQMETFEPRVAWRAVLGPDDSVYMLHQYETTRPLLTAPQAFIAAPYGGSMVRDPRCDGRVVTTAVTRFEAGRPTGSVLVPFAAPAIDVDVVGNSLLIAGGGSYGASAALVDATFSNPASCATARDIFLTDAVAVAPQVVAVAHSADEYLVQTRDDATLRAYSDSSFVETPIAAHATWTLALTATRSSIGLALFQAPTRIGLACASCHPEGGDDGHVWRLLTSNGVVRRRTPSLRGGLLATAPFHWDGNLSNLHELVDDVFTTRMGGPDLPQDTIASLSTWLDSIPALPAPSNLDSSAVSRGQTLFGSSGCTTCHSGPKLTNNLSVDVGTGGRFQVPSLVGVGARAPYMHDGCAPTLMARLREPACAGANHGKLSDLASTDLVDLQVFLQSL